MRLAAIEQVPHLIREIGVFRSKRTTGWRNRKRCNRLFQCQKPPNPENGFRVAFGFRCCLNPEGHIAAHLGKELSGRTSAPRLHVFIAPLDASTDSR